MTALRALDRRTVTRTYGPFFSNVEWRQFVRFVKSSTTNWLDLVQGIAAEHCWYKRGSDCWRQFQAVPYLSS